MNCDNNHKQYYTTYIYLVYIKQKSLLIIREPMVNMFITPNIWLLLYFSNKKKLYGNICYFFEKIIYYCDKLLFLKVAGNL